MSSGWKNEDPRVLLKVAVGIAVAVGGGLLTNRIRRRREREILRARQAGRILRAERIRGRSTEKESGVVCHSVYEYTVNGKKKQYRIRYGVPPLFLYLYYNEGSGRVFSEYDHVEGGGYALVTLAGMAACIPVMSLTGCFAAPV